MDIQNRTFVFSTPLGNLQAVYQSGCLRELDLAPHKKPDNPDNEFEKKLIFEFNEYFNGRLKIFSIPVKPDGTEFQKKVWHEISGVRYGETITYRELASRVKNETYARAIGGAVGKNPVMIIIPCHRIVGSHGIGGYSGGIEIKKELLTLEGVRI